MEGTLAAELERHRRLESELAELGRSRGAEDDPLGLRDTVIQARTDAYNLGLTCGAVVTAAWALKRMRDLVELPQQSWASFAGEIEAEISEMADAV